MKLNSITYTLCLLLIFVNNIGLAQTEKNLKPISSDCEKAIVITINKITTYGPSVAPNGYGEQQEFERKTSFKKNVFEKEHNSVWYKLNMQHDGEFIFEIIPEDTLNDYDFVLYQIQDSSTFCNDIVQQKLEPSRSNICRNDISNKSVTGLSRESIQTFHGKGIGNQYSKSIAVKKGQQYMLILDNVYDNGKGHTLKFNYIKDVVIDGIVLNDVGKPLRADMIFTDNKGDEIKKTSSDEDGRYHLDLTLMENVNYSLTFLNDSSFVSSQLVNTMRLHNDSNFLRITTILPKLKKGKKYKLGNINFFGESPEYLPVSLPSIEALYQLMKRNKKMKIQIEGHVNVPNSTKEQQVGEAYYNLSLARATTIRTYLNKKGIGLERIQVIGLGATKMLYPYAQGEAEQSANRRVEINVISLDED